MQTTLNYKKILVPIDFSDGSRNAFYVALEYTRLFQTETVLLHVREGLVMTVKDVETHDADVANMEAGIIRRLNELADKGNLKPENRARLSFEVVGGKPWVEIVNFAHNNDIDLIVMGTHGNTGLKSILIGSQAERVVRRANCHVLAVKPEGFDSTLEGVPDRFKV